MLPIVLLVILEARVVSLIIFYSLLSNNKGEWIEKNGSSKAVMILVLVNTLHWRCGYPQGILRFVNDFPESRLTVLIAGKSNNVENVEGQKIAKSTKPNRNEKHSAY